MSWRSDDMTLSNSFTVTDADDVAVRSPATCSAVHDPTAGLTR
jgi:hypothetical protein